VARFIGAANLVPGQVTDVSTHPRVAVRTALGDLRPLARQSVAVGDAVLVLLRPEQVAVHTSRPANGGGLEAILVHLLFAGAATECVLDAGSLRLRAQVREAAPLRRGMKVFLAVDEAGCALVPRGRGAAYPPRGQDGSG
jgi:ABC-type Fe3+/spermidine/putrescine transport system ATPase subunit